MQVRAKIFCSLLVSWFALSSCSLGNGKVALRVSFPQDSIQSIGLKSSSNFFMLGTLPSSVSDFNCFGVLVTAETSSLPPEYACESGGERSGIWFGLASVADATIEAQVPIGPRRKISIVGVQTVDGKCTQIAPENLEAVMLQGEVMAYTNILGEKEIDLFEDATADIEISFDALAPVPFEHPCGVAGNALPSPAPSPSQGIFAIQPNMTSILPVLWWDAADLTSMGGVLSGWTDKMNSRPFSVGWGGSPQDPPVIESIIQSTASVVALTGPSKPYLYEDHAAFPSVAGALSQRKRTVLIVYKTDPSAVSAGAQGNLYSEAFATSGNPGALTSAMGAFYRIWQQYSPGLEDIQAVAASSTNAPIQSSAQDTSLVDSNFHIVALVAQADGTVHLSIDGEAMASPATKVDFEPLGSERIRIGIDQYNGAFFNGRVGDVIVYGEAIPTDMNLSVHCYLSSKFGIPLSGINCQ